VQRSAPAAALAAPVTFAGIAGDVNISLAAAPLLRSVRQGGG